MTHPSRKPLVIGNWKMHGTLASNSVLMQALLQGTRNIVHTQMAVCAPFPYLAPCREQLQGTAIQWGA
ncbi:MAG TPA: triose-phosphate isomerase, partial [Pseudomonadales bacterium]|nr:triose-phosphate isomerase [Pseudomonadales bacterium]